MRCKRALFLPAFLVICIAVYWCLRVKLVAYSSQHSSSVRFGGPATVTEDVFAVPPPTSNMSRPAPDSPMGPGTAAPGEPYWMEKIKHQGVAAFNPRPGEYQVFRNVKDFGAIGDGRADDTEAIK